MTAALTYAHQASTRDRQIYNLSLLISFTAGIVSFTRILPFDDNLLSSATSSVLDPMLRTIDLVECNPLQPLR